MKQHSNITVREAMPEDASVMMSLIKELAKYENAPDEVTVSMEHFLECGFGAQPIWWALVAEHTDPVSSIKTVVGFALYYMRYSTWKGRRLYLEDIIVTEAWRARGIGSLLMDSLIAVSAQKKVTGMMWQVLEWNEPAIRFYQKYHATFDNEWINVSLPIKFFPEN